MTEQQHQEDLQRLSNLRPIDDDFMRCLFKDNIPLAEFVLRIITDKKDLIITDCETQKDMKKASWNTFYLLGRIRNRFIWKKV